MLLRKTTLEKEIQEAVLAHVIRLTTAYGPIVEDVLARREAEALKPKKKHRVAITRSP